VQGYRSGDYKMLSADYSHQGQNAKYGCVVCKEQFGQQQPCIVPPAADEREPVMRELDEMIHVGSFLEPMHMWVSDRGCQPAYGWFGSPERCNNATPLHHRARFLDVVAQQLAAYPAIAVELRAQGLHDDVTPGKHEIMSWRNAESSSSVAR
jgi:hypothetical protein